MRGDTDTNMVHDVIVFPGISLALGPGGRRPGMASILRTASWAFRSLHSFSAPLSARMSSKRADGSRALAEKVAVITGSTKG